MRNNIFCLMYIFIIAYTFPFLSVPKNGLILPVAFMGAPSVVVEKLIRGSELQTAAEKIQALVITDEKDVEVSTSRRGVKYVKNMPEFPSQVVREIQF